MAKYPLETIRHSAAHVMAAAVKELYPDAKFDIGPSTDTGFYYDFDLGETLTPDDLKKIEGAINKIINMKHDFTCVEYTREEAENFLKSQNQTYKLERLNDIPEGDKITFYEVAGFSDLCRGPHVENTSQIGVVKLLNVAGSYFRGNENNPMLQRIYGTAFTNKKELNAYMKQLEEAAKRDHRKLGKELELFTMSDAVGPGLVLWLPKGAYIRHLIETFWKDEHFKNGYELLYTPHIGRANLWETSGHLSFYKEGMYSAMDVDGQEYYPKPMNCPFHVEIYKNRGRSYKELPARWAELGTVYRYEKSGALHGLFRVRGFTQDDAHIICTPEQVENEIAEVLRFCLYIWDCFGFKDIQAYISTRPEKAVGEPERWELAQKSLENAVKEVGIECAIDEGGGAFYGPKIDLKIKDAIGREWQTSTIQFDFNLPERFDMTYIGEDGKKHRPYMIHRALFGSLERFFGIITEHFAGAFPVWLAPVQIALLPISAEQHEYVNEFANELRAKGFRVEVNLSDEPIGAKIKAARNARIQYIAVAGEREVQADQLSVRTRAAGQLGAISKKELLEKLQIDVEKKL